MVGLRRCAVLQSSLFPAGGGPNYERNAGPSQVVDHRSGEESQMTRPMRRVVTGHNAEGKSIILIDGPSPHALEVDGMPGLALINLWVTDRAPAGNTGSVDAAARPVVLEPPNGGTIFRVVDFPPAH